MTIPNVMRVNADGSGDPVQVIERQGHARTATTWQSWIREPVLSPDGQTLAMVSDGPTRSNSDVVLQFYDTTTQEVDRPDADRDRAARPPGSGLAAGRQGAALRPQRPRRRRRARRSIWRWDVAKGKATRR